MSTTKTWPGGGTGAVPAAYSIPAAGELNWAALSNFLNALGDGAQSTTFQKFSVRKATTTPVTVSGSTDCVVATNLGTPGAVAVNLPAGATKQIFFIVDDKGDAASNNITITPNGAETIQGAATLVLSHAHQGVMLAYSVTDTDWKVVLNTLSPGSVTSADIVGAILPNKGGTGIINNNAATLTWSGNFATTFTTTNTTGVTLPTTGTLATLAGSESLTNKTLTSPIIVTDERYSNQATAKFYEQTGNGTNYMGLSAPNAVTADVTLKLPDGDGAANQLLKTDGSGNLGWVSPLTNPMTTAGDLIVGGALGAATRLAGPGAAGYVVASTGATTTAFTQTPTLVGATASLTIQSDASNSLLPLDGYNTTSAIAPALGLNRSKSGTIGTQTTVASGDALGAISFRGSNGTFFDDAAAIVASCDGTVTGSAMPGRIAFLTSPSGSDVPTEAMRIESHQAVMVGVTSYNSNGGCLQLKSGITFPASQVASTDANTLDDYEEGTWTPTIAFGLGSTGITYSAQSGQYTKIGRSVMLGFTVILSNKGSSTGSATVGGFPFTIGSGSALVSGQFHYQLANPSTYVLAPFFPTNSGANAYAFVNNPGSNGDNTTVAVTNIFMNNSSFLVGGCIFNV